MKQCLLGLVLHSIRDDKCYVNPYLPTQTRLHCLFIKSSLSTQAVYTETTLSTCKITFLLLLQPGYLKSLMAEWLEKVSQ